MPIMNSMTICYLHDRPARKPLITKIFSLFHVLILLSGAFVLSSCEDEGTLIGKGILPGSDFVSVFSTDTLTMKSFTRYTDSIPSLNPSTSYLGRIYDPYFGTTTAAFVSQLRLSEEWSHDFITIDSIKLVLTLSPAVGDTAGPHYLRMQEIDRQIYVDTVYYSNDPIPLTGFSIPDIQLPQMRTDTINQIIVDIPNSFGEYITRNMGMLFHDNSRPDFRSYFKGLKFSLVSSGDPIFLSLSLASPGVLSISQNYFVMYFHDEVDVPDEYFFILDAKTNNARFNTFFHNFDDADPVRKISHINDTYRDTLTYLQSFNGVYTRIEIPGLAELKSNTDFDGISVNKARLICPVHYDGEIYKPATFPSQLFMRYYTATGAKYLVPDYSISSTFFDGTKDTLNSVYNFNIASYLQYYFEDSDNDLLPVFDLVLPSGASTNAILKANNSSSPLKFEFTYTRF